MAKTRMINTRFWGDGYIAELDPLEKLLFLYFLTNQHTDICGVYELPIRTVVFETGIDDEKVRNIISRFTLDGKIEYVDGWVIVKNFLKHQHKTSPTVAQGIARSLKDVPESIRARIGYPYPIDTVPHSDLDLDSDLDSRETAAPQPKWFDEIPAKAPWYTDLVKELAETDYFSTKQIHQEITQEFLPHWLEKGERSKKARWEKETSFDPALRIRKWIRNKHSWAKDVKCAVAGVWHRKGESCYHEKSGSPQKKSQASPIPKVDTTPLSAEALARLDEIRKDVKAGFKERKVTHDNV